METVHYSAEEQQFGSEFITPDKSEELSFIVPIQKWVQNFWPLTNQRNCPLKCVYRNGFRISDPCICLGRKKQSLSKPAHLTK